MLICNGMSMLVVKFILVCILILNCFNCGCSNTVLDPVVRLLLAQAVGWGFPGFRAFALLYLFCINTGIPLTTVV